MILSDIFYGDFELEDILSDLISSGPVQRLKNVHQGGAIFLVSPNLNHNRYEHSIGVMLLVRKIGGSLQEQIAALIHDVSHTAFSHVIDYVLQQNGEDYHEQIFDEVIANSTIPSILDKYGFSTSLFQNPKHTLLEMPLPALCADRIDYTVRDLYHFGLIDIVEVHDFINELGVHDGKIGVKSKKAASWITSKYLQLNNTYFRKPALYLPIASLPN
ncbi:MAG: HD domain-containing protein [Pedobacter sp.]|nr:MAG: HD domain-containing protein [Pedobacter sp.]